MKINWKVRIKSAKFWIVLASAIAAPLLATAGVTLEQVTSWSLAWQIIRDGLANPFVVLSIVTAVVSVLGIVIDPTTAGISDSAQALTYETPKKDN